MFCIPEHLVYTLLDHLTPGALTEQSVPRVMFPHVLLCVPEFITPGGFRWRCVPLSTPWQQREQISRWFAKLDSGTIYFVVWSEEAFNWNRVEEQGGGADNGVAYRRNRAVERTAGWHPGLTECRSRWRIKVEERTVVLGRRNRAEEQRGAAITGCWAWETMWKREQQSIYENSFKRIMLLYTYVFWMFLSRISCKWILIGNEFNLSLNAIIDWECSNYSILILTA